MIKATAYAGAFVGAAMHALLPAAQADTVTDYEVIYAPAMQATKAPKTVLTEITYAGDRTIAVGDYGVIIYRDSNDQPWQQAEVPTSVLFTSVDFADANRGWAVGHHGVIAATTDGGKTWQRQLDGFEYIQLQKTHFENLVAELTAQQDELDGSDADAEEELYVALDNATFALEMALLAEEDGPTKPFLDVRALSSQVILAVGAYGSLIRSTDGGASWHILDNYVENPDGFHFNALAADNDYVYLAGESGQVFRSADQGTTWETLDSPYYGSFFGLHVDAQGNLWIVGLRGNIFMSTDQGESFSQIKLEDTVNINAVVDAATGGVYLVGNAGVIGWVNQQGDIENMTHASGAALTDLITNKDGSLTVVGQRGVIEIPQFSSIQQTTITKEQ